MLPEALKQEIQQAYTRFLESTGWQARTGQKQMIAAIARILGDVEQDAEGKRTGSANHLCVVEAGTGTGKTVGYCLAAIPVAKALNKTLVISTATVALQEQIVHKDLPDLARHAGLSFRFALAKGRARYVCPAKLDTQLEGLAADSVLALYPDEIPVQNSEATTALFQEMASTLASASWDGDRDSWPRHIDTADWYKVTTDHRQCTGRRCAYIAQCPFFKARDQVGGVDVVVANHDLVLADLALGGGAILPAPEDSIYVFDEGHHLADKAINHFACHTRLESSRKFLRQSDKTLATMAKTLGSGIATVGSQLEKAVELSREVQALLEQASQLIEQDIDFSATEKNNLRRAADHATKRYRFPHGVIPETLREQAVLLAYRTRHLNAVLVEVAEQLRQTLEGTSEVPRHLVEQWYPAIGLVQSRVESQSALWASYAEPDRPAAPPQARWLVLHTEGGAVDIEISSSPVESALDLDESLWQRCFAAVITSATLTALGRFDRFCRRSGVPPTANFLVIQSPFNFSQAVLSLPGLHADPSDTAAHTDEVTSFINQSIDRKAGALVLFSSRRQMEDVFAGLERDLQKQVLLQGDLSKQEMIAEHKRRINAGQGSVLFGLASFAEGIDLPGAYCTHVVIAKIPFAVPDDPVEEALSEWIEKNGGNAFMDIAVPDAAMRLLQACGRLLRHEEDSGTITLLDKRIVSKRYGRLILDSLPPYTRQLQQ